MMNDTLQDSIKTDQCSSGTTTKTVDPGSILGRVKTKIIKISTHSSLLNV